MHEQGDLSSIGSRLALSDPELARMLGSFSVAPRDQVPWWIAVLLLGVATLLAAGALSTGSTALFEGTVLVAASTPVAWLVGLARRVDDAPRPSE